MQEPALDGTLSTRTTGQRTFFEMNIHARPFIKWAGSKRKLLRHIAPFVPEKFNTYYEPFFGSGALFFAINPNSARLGDACNDLVETYNSCAQHPNEILSELKRHKVNRDYYYSIRSNRSIDPIKRASEFLYLNKTCWNGLYRVNLSGNFNVPYGQPKSSTLIDEENFLKATRALGKARVSLKKQDFALTCSTAGEGDFVFLDPPYVTTHNNNGFLEWNEEIFSWEDQERLAKLAAKLADKGAHVVVTNAAHEAVIDLYRRFDLKYFERSSTLASKINARGRVSEAIFHAGTRT